MATAGAALQHVPMPDLGPPGAPGMFAFADREHVGAILDQAGFQGIGVDPVEAQMRLGDDAEDAVAFLRDSGVGRVLLEGADEESRSRALAAVADALRAHERSDGVYLNGAAWLVTANNA